MSRDRREVAWRQHQRHETVEPSATLAPYVSHYWTVEWDYEEPYRQLIAPLPHVHLSFGERGAAVHGVSSSHLIRDLEGRGRVFGVAFRPGRFRPFLGAAVRTITDRVIAADALFEGLPATGDVPQVERMLRLNLPDPDRESAEAAAIVERIAADPTVQRVDALADELATTVRTLQRLFAEHVGVGPKWVIRRYRVREVTDRMAAGERIDWAGVAADLGYADQAHFVRDFTAMVGESPTRYAERY